MSRWWPISDGLLRHAPLPARPPVGWHSALSKKDRAMSQIPDHGINDPDVHADAPVLARASDACDPPCAEALLAGTLALMTGHAQACCGEHRGLMAAKAASNLLLLSQHPLMSPRFQAVAWKLHAQWTQPIQAAQSPRAAPAEPAAARPDPSRALWHTTPEVIQ